MAGLPHTYTGSVLAFGERTTIGAGLTRYLAAPGVQRRGSGTGNSSRGQRFVSEPGGGIGRGRGRRRREEQVRARTTVGPEMTRHDGRIVASLLTGIHRDGGTLVVRGQRSSRNLGSRARS